MKLAIVDDGINTNIFLKKCQTFIVRNGSVEKMKKNNAIKTLSHATIIAEIIDEEINDIECEYISVKIINNEFLQGSVSDLIIALRWCLYNDIDIINLSVGSTQYYDKELLIDIISKLLYKGIVIIAAMSNKYVLTYPASMNGVIGVKYDPFLFEKEFYFDIDSRDGIQFSAGCKQSICNHDIVPCSSFATASVTGKIIRTFEREINDNVRIEIGKYFKRKIENRLYPLYNYFFMEKNELYTPCIRFKIFDKNTELLEVIMNIINYLKSVGYYAIFVNRKYWDINRDIYAIDRSFYKNEKMSEDVYAILFFDKIANPDIIIIMDDIKLEENYIDFEILLHDNMFFIQGEHNSFKYHLPLAEKYKFIADRIIMAFKGFDI